MSNWITDLDIQCEPKWKTSLVGSLFFTGVVFSSFILHFASRYGRRINVIAGAYVTLATWIGLLFVKNLYAKYFFVFMLGLSYSKNVQSYVLSSEIAPDAYKVYVTTATLCLNGVVLPLTAVYFKFINQEWSYVFYAYGLIILVMTF